MMSALFLTDWRSRSSVLNGLFIISVVDSSFSCGYVKFAAYILFF